MWCLGSSSVRVVRTRHDVHGAVTGHEIAVAKSQGLSDAHARLSQQSQEESVAQMLAGTDDGEYLLCARCGRHPLGNGQFHRSDRNRLVLGRVIEEGLVAATTGGPPS